MDLTCRHIFSLQSRGLPGESGDVARVGGHVEDAEQTVTREPEPAGRREVRRLYTY